MPSLKEWELRESTQCAICESEIGHAGLAFFSVFVEQHVVDLGVMKRQDGLATMLGGYSDLAQYMGTDPDMTEVIRSVKVAICQQCVLSGQVTLLDILGSEE